MQFRKILQFTRSVEVIIEVTKDDTQPDSQIWSVRMNLRKRYRDIAEMKRKNREFAIAYRPAGKQISIIVRSLSGLRSSIDEREQGDREDKREKRWWIDERAECTREFCVHRPTRSICPANLARIPTRCVSARTISSIWVQLKRECHACRERGVQKFGRVCVCVGATRLR